MKRFLKPVGLAVVVLALLASVVAGREKPSITPAEPVAAMSVDLSRIERSRAEAPAADPFAPKNFNPPAREAQQAPREAKPEAPPLPFRYLGKLIEDGKLAVFLSRGGESLSVAQGDTIGDYRLDAVSETEITFTSLPLKAKQKLPL
jgi:hypothetical protein